MNKIILIVGIIGILITGVIFFVWQRQVQFQTPLEEAMEPLAIDAPTATPSDWADISFVVDHIAIDVSPDDSQLDKDKPFLVYDINHQPIYWKLLFRKDEEVVGYANIDVKSGEILQAGTFGKPLKHYLDPPTAEAALDQAQDMLSQHTDVTIDLPFFYGPNREGWLILVHRGDEVVDRIRVWGDESRHEPAEDDGIER